MNRCCVLIMAKAPVPGRVKTRLCPDVDAETAARIAAASLLDTIETARAVPGALPVLALAGNPRDGVYAESLLAALRGIPVLGQRGTGLGARLANAHADTGNRYAKPVLQLGMDTPQLGAEQLSAAIETLLEAPSRSVLGPAEDGGWWALGLHEPRLASVLREVPMSTSDTVRETENALREAGTKPVPLPRLSDVDTMADALRAAEIAPHGRFSAEVSRAASRIRS